MLHIYLITGLSGAGKSTTLRCLEDVGFFCVDNLPLLLIPSFLQVMSQSSQAHTNVALGIDIRARCAIPELGEQLAEYRKCNEYSIRVVFLTASVSILLQRFQETRRKHPLGDALSIYDAIEQEKILLEPLIQQADIVINTDQLTVQQLRAFIQENIIQQKTSMLVNLMSFGFKYGVPREPNFVYDIRCLPNPYFVAELSLLDGKDERIQAFLFSNILVQNYFDKLRDFLEYSLVQSYKEGRFFVHVAIGCTGGKHRSVAFVEKLAHYTIDNIQFVVKHRDILRKY